MNFRTMQKFPNGIDVNKITAMLTEKKRQLFEKAAKSQNYPDFGQYDVTMVINYLNSLIFIKWNQSWSGKYFCFDFLFLKSFGACPNHNLGYTFIACHSCFPQEHFT